jgi:hypothetical protein
MLDRTLDPEHDAVLSPALQAWYTARTTAGALIYIQGQDDIEAPVLA